MVQVPVQLLLVATTLAGAAAKLTCALTASSLPWRQRGRAFSDAVDELGHGVDALRFLPEGELRTKHIGQMRSAIDDAVALAMRLHNLLPQEHPASPAAFDAASAASALLAALPLPTDGGDQMARVG